MTVLRPYQRESIDAVITTLFEAILLVVLVVATTINILHPLPIARIRAFGKRSTTERITRSWRVA